MVSAYLMIFFAWLKNGGLTSLKGSGLNVKSSIANFLGMSQIDVLRVSAIVHNILGMVVATFFMVHVYMAAIAIKGAIHSMITGYKEEEEVAILHSSWYKQLKEEGKV